MEDLKYHDCDRNESWWEYDGRGIPLCRVCDTCREAKLSKFSKTVMHYYDERDIDEQIEADIIGE